MARTGICRLIEELYNQHGFLLQGNLLNDKEKAYFQEVCAGTPDNAAAVSLKSLMNFLSRYYGKKVIMLLDEYDVMLEPKSTQDDAVILEFKVHRPRTEKNLEEAVKNALLLIEEKEYVQALVEKGLPKDRIRTYGFAFEGKRVLIGGTSI